MIYVANAFSLQMLDGATLSQQAENLLRTYQIQPHTARLILAGEYPDAPDAPIESCIGHPDLAAIAGAALGLPPFAVNRQSVVLKADDWLVVAQYAGARLEEGAKTLPAGAKITWWLVHYAAPGVLE